MAHIALNAHLLHGAATYRSAGIHQYIGNLLHYLPMVAPDLRYTAFVGAGQPEMSGHATIHRSRWPTQRPLVRILWEQLVQPLALLRLRPDLLHSLAFAGPLLNPCPNVVTVYDVSFRLMPEKFPAAQRLYLSAFTAYTCRTARRILAISESGKRDLQTVFNLPADKIDVAYPGVDARFRPLPTAEVEAFRSQRGLPQHFIFYLGTLEPRKNLGTLIEAYHQLALTQPELRLVIGGGKGWFYQELFQLVETLNLQRQVLFPGFVPADELPLWYNAAAVFAYPSSFEGFGLPVAEALACGRPVVTSNVASLPEAGGEAAWHVNPNDVEALTQALHEALLSGDARRTLGLAHAARFTWSATAEQTVKAYQKVIGK